MEQVIVGACRGRGWAGATGPFIFTSVIVTYPAFCLNLTDNQRVYRTEPFWLTDTA